MKFKQPSFGTKLVTLTITNCPVPMECILLSIFDELDTDALSYGRVGLFCFNTNFLQYDSLSVRSSLQRGGLPGCSKSAFTEMLICPSVFTTVDSEFACGVEPCGFSFTHSRKGVGESSWTLSAVTHTLSSGFLKPLP